MPPQNRIPLLPLLTIVVAVVVSPTAPLQSPPHEPAALDPPNTKLWPFTSNKEDDDSSPGHTFSYEFMSPQKILTGCAGTKFPSGKMKTSYYFIDATGTKKFIAPNQPAEVVFPPPPGHPPGLLRKQKVYMFEMCFPAPCNVEGSSSCGPSGSTIGPAGSWGFPKFTWPWTHPSLSSPWTDDSKYFFNLNSQGNAAASLSTDQAHLSFGFSGNAGAGKDKPQKGPSDPAMPPPPPPPGWGGPVSHHPPASQNPGGGGWASASAEAAANATVTDTHVQGGASAEAEAEVSAGNGGSASAEAEASAHVSFGGGGWTPPPTTTTTAAPTTTEVITTTTTEPETTQVPTEEPTTTTTTTVAPPCNSPTTTTEEPTTTAEPTTTTEGWGWTEPPTTTAEPTTTTSEPTTTTAEPTTTTEPTTTAEPTTTTGPDCPGDCPCCDKCPISKLMDKLIISGFSNFIGKVASSQPGGLPPHTQWGGRGGKGNTEGQIVDPVRHYASLPGSIRGDVPVIYYPSCNPNAYYQPAIINYCTGWGRDDFEKKEGLEGGVEGV